MVGDVPAVLSGVECDVYVQECIYTNASPARPLFPHCLRHFNRGRFLNPVARPTGNGLLFCTVVWFSRGLHPRADMAVAAQGCRAVPYCPRDPEHTILYQIIQQHLETYLRLAREDDWDGERVPAAALDRPAGAGLWVTGISPLARMRHHRRPVRSGRRRPGPLPPGAGTDDG